MAGQGAGVPQAPAAALFGPGGNAGVLLLNGQRSAVFAGGGGEAGAAAKLPACARVSGFGVAAAVLLAAPGIPDPVTATAAFPAFFKDGVEAGSDGTEPGASAALFARAGIFRRLHGIHGPGCNAAATDKALQGRHLG